MVLPGAASAPMRLQRLLSWALVAVVGGGMAIMVVVVAISMVDGTIAPGTGLAVIIGGVALAIVFITGLTLWFRRMRTGAVQEHEPVVLDSTGLTMNGVGPIPWEDFEPAGSALVPAEFNSGRTLRTVMMLTPSGRERMNTLLPRELRQRIAPARDTLSGPGVATYLRLPGVRGMGGRDVKGIINSARDVVRPHG